MTKQAVIRLIMTIFLTLRVILILVNKLRPQPNEIDVLLIYSVLHCFLSSPCYTLYCTLAASEIVLVTR